MKERKISLGETLDSRAASLDQELRAYMLRVYNYMAGGLFVSAFTAYLTLVVLVNMPYEYMRAFYGSSLYLVIAFMPLAPILYISFRAHTMSIAAMQTAYWVFVFLQGVSLSSIFIIYELTSIVKIFLITACTFLGLSIYGYTTKRDLLSLGAWLYMALIGLVIAMIVNILVGSPAFDYLISIAGVLIFVLFTAYDTQKIKVSFLQGRGTPNLGGAYVAKSAVLGALKLYLDFINLFLFLLRLFGARRR